MSKIGEPLSLSDVQNKVKKPKLKYFDVSEGNNVHRVLPPFGDLAELGVWISKFVVHWGYKTSTGQHRLFRCLGKDCPECAIINEAKEKLALLQQNEVLNKEPIDLVKAFLKLHNLDIHYCMNSLNQKGEIGRLKIKKKMFDALQAQEKKLQKHKIHPASAERGVWLNFEKIGSGTTAIWNVEPVKEEKIVDGEITSVLKLAPLSKDILDRMDMEAADLSKQYKALTLEDVNKLVSSVVDYEADATVVDEVFNFTPQGDASFDPVKLENKEKKVKAVGVPKMHDGTANMKMTVEEDPLSKYFK